jgi:hypothetical protein
MAESTVRLNQPVAAGGTPRTYFFNGRLLSAEDLKREQTLRETGQSQLARLIGCGIAAGLDVSGGAGSSALSIAAGLGVTPSGQVIDIDTLDLDLAGAASSRRPGGFGTCAAAMANLEAPAAGIYLLVLSTDWIGSGRAATLLGEVGACNRAVEQPAVRARLLKVTAPVEATTETARNLIASTLLTPDDPTTVISHATPVDTPAGALRLIGWWPTRIVPTLSAADLPVALLRIDSDAKLIWLDGAAARRRVAPPPGLAGDTFWRESHALEMEAFGQQFVAQALDEAARRAKDESAPGAAAFVTLPPVAVIDKQAFNTLLSLFHNKESGTLAISRGNTTIVGRADFVSALHEGLQDATVSVNDASASVLHLRDTEQYLLRLQHQEYRSGIITTIESGSNERSSKKLASLAGHTLHDRNADPEKRSLAASVLTQAPDKTKRRSPRKPKPPG